MTPTLNKKTPYRQSIDERDEKVYAEYMQLAADNYQSKTELRDYIMEKYGFHSTATLYRLLRRVEERRKAVKKAGRKAQKGGAA